VSYELFRKKLENNFGMKAWTHDQWDLVYKKVQFLKDRVFIGIADAILMTNKGMPTPAQALEVFTPFLIEASRNKRYQGKESFFKGKHCSLCKGSGVVMGYTKPHPRYGYVTEAAFSCDCDFVKINEVSDQYPSYRSALVDGGYVWVRPERLFDPIGQLYWRIDNKRLVQNDVSIVERFDLLSKSPEKLTKQEEDAIKQLLSVVRN
jgi:hypothetical protein